MRGDRRYGGAVTYNPRSGALIRRHVNVEDGERLVALACPSKTQCSAVDNNGSVLTFQPRTGKSLAADKIDAPVGLDAPSGNSNDELDGIACPTVRLCVGVDTLGNAVQFNPRSNHGATPKAIDARRSLTAVACPSRRECVAVDSGGRAPLGNPRTGSWSVKPLRATRLTAIACTSQAECVAVDSVAEAFRGIKR